MGIWHDGRRGGAKQVLCQIGGIRLCLQLSLRHGRAQSGSINTRRCGERMVMGEENVTTAGGGDLVMANNIAREMVYRCGFSPRIGPVALMDNEEVYLNRERDAQRGQHINAACARCYGGGPVGATKSGFSSTRRGRLLNVK